MNALIRAALVGAVIGIGEAALAQVVDDDILVFLAMLAMPLPAGMLLTLWGRLPWWWLISILGPGFIVMGFIAAPVRPAEIAGMGGWGSLLVFMGIGAAGYLFAGATVLPLRVVTRMATIGTVLVLGIAVVLGDRPLSALVAAQMMAREQVPIIATDQPDYRLDSVNEEEGILFLRYERRRDGLEVAVTVQGPHGLTAGQACGSGVRGACKEVAPGIWGDHLDLGSTLVTVRGNTLVEVTGELAKDDLLAVLRDVRPMNAWELAWLALKDSSYDLGMIVAG
ncbi:hypothetical protein B0I32_11721 [Nonomuraea fuscirosea]|uniref:Uncharacterized protein n=1 Tax=Nonomuraea fuscirosea TaxID=1291556 RepID=A0A2T0MQ33_9ACTN|nr:hypothetical protein [Nonomuraea fuscirosea]PRX60254.1 hypothetical protein B0I32_11721 [Nonomuraea fuscirosea]